jgi:nucleoid-associated protein YgaU
VLRQVSVPSPTPDALVAAAAALLGWLVLAWLGVGVLVTLGEVVRVPLLRQLGGLAPTALRAAVRTSLGVGLAAGILPTAVAQAAVPAEPPSSVVRVVDDDAPAWPSLDRPSRPVDDDTRSSAHERRTYVVVAGDTLWDIARAHLPGSPTASEVATSWPRWWRINRSTIGVDPGVIRPGQVLRIPGSAS